MRVCSDRDRRAVDRFDDLFQPEGGSSRTVSVVGRGIALLAAKAGTAFDRRAVATAEAVAWNGVTWQPSLFTTSLRSGALCHVKEARRDERPFGDGTLFGIGAFPEQ